MKDRFSSVSGNYSRFRPVYPADLIEYVCSLTPERDAAWDCGTGNGQLAAALSVYFKEVQATDISAEQLAQAPKLPNIRYRIASAESMLFGKQQFDLITVAQAIHWFDMDTFYKEVYRCLKPTGIIAVMGYGLLQVNERIDPIINHLYKDVLGNYWDKERKYIDELYQTIPFPFQELNCPHFQMNYQWSLDQLKGYLSTWSAVKLFEKQEGSDPLELIWPDILHFWSEGKEQVRFRILLRVGRLDKKRTL